MRPRAAATLVMVGALLAACGGGAPDGEGSGPPGSADPGKGSSDGSQEDLEDAARSAFEAFLAGDFQTYFNLVVSDCRESAGFSGVNGYLETRRSRAFNAGVDLAEVSVTAVDVTDFTGSEGTVALVIDSPGGEQWVEGQPQPWVHEDDGWRFADCSPFASGGNNGGDEGSSADNPLGRGLFGEPADWLVATTYFSPDFTDLVLEEPGNASPAPGNVYFGVQMTFTYNGPKPSTVFGDDLAFRLEADGTTYDGPNGCGTYPQEPDLDLTAGPGDTTLFTLCWEIPAGDDADARIVVTDRAAGTDWWFAASE